MTEQVYHERQSKQLCALHVLNNLFQVIFFVKEPFFNLYLPEYYMGGGKLISQDTSLFF